ncbi:heavy-metal-associated domain-containing protein [Anatilimnocola sp. NA78]|uniref:heavy-metal-associated domain-containing protein n=1 Tax=Anatilimnocola sp. NA78 TaxID=3415683 RepID=UPI003CE4DEE0
MSNFANRRLCLVSAAAMLLFTGGLVSAQQPAPQQEQIYTAILKVPSMCCGKESGPAIAEISKIPGVVKVVPDYKTRTLTIMPTSNAISHRAIWEAAERAKVPPTELATLVGVYKSKPQR